MLSFIIKLPLEAKSNEMAADIEEEMNQLADRACIKGCCNIGTYMKLTRVF